VPVPRCASRPVPSRERWPHWVRGFFAPRYHRARRAIRSPIPNRGPSLRPNWVRSGKSRPGPERKSLRSALADGRWLALLPSWRLASFGESDSMPNWRLASFGARASAAILAAGFVRRGPMGTVRREFTMPRIVTYCPAHPFLASFGATEVGRGGRFDSFGAWDWLRSPPRATAGSRALGAIRIHLSKILRAKPFLFIIVSGLVRVRGFCLQESEYPPFGPDPLSTLDPAPLGKLEQTLLCRKHPGPSRWVAGVTSS
jgi:hypothetical protein